MSQIITTPNGSKFDTEIPCKSHLVTVLNGKGRQVMDTLYLTGRTNEIEWFREKHTELEVEGSFFTGFICETYLHQ